MWWWEEISCSGSYLHPQPTIRPKVSEKKSSLRPPMIPLRSLIKRNIHGDKITISNILPCFKQKAKFTNVIFSIIHMHHQIIFSNT